MKNSIFVCGVMICALLSSCGSGKKSVERVDTVALSSTIIINDDALRKPCAMAVGNDRLYILNMSYTVDTLIDEFTLDGQFVRSFLTKGQGPGEIVSAEAISYDATNNSLLINDYMIRGKLMAVEQLSSDGPQLKTIITLQTEENDSVLPTDLLMPLCNNMYVAGNQPASGMLGIYNSEGEFVRLVQPYPDEAQLGTKLPDFALYNFFRMSGKRAPDGKHFAACSNANILVTGEADSDTVVTHSIVGEPQNGIEVVNIGENISFSYNDNYKIFFPGGITVSNSGFYIQCGGLQKELLTQWHKMKDGEIKPENYVKVYDFDGNIIKILKLDVGQCYLSVSPDDSSLYAITETDEGYSVHRFDLNY